MSAPVIRLHVERLVLEDLDLRPGEAPRLRAALQAELTRLLAVGGLDPALMAGGAQPTRASAALDTEVGATPDALGADLARSIYAGLGP